MFQKFIRLNQAWSKSFDKYFVPKSWTIDGLKDYVNNVVPPLIKDSSKICDIGGGKRPFVGTEVPKKNSYYILGIDIDKDELDLAPPDIYDKTVVADIGATKLDIEVGKSTLVICEAVLEHVKNNKRALNNISKLTQKNGQIALFIPSRNALFAVINRYMPEKTKKTILYNIFPETKHAQGFPAYYDMCTPSQIKSLFIKNGIKTTEVKCYFHSSYFSFFLPLHIFWRLYQLCCYLIIGNDAAESFSIVGIKE